MRKKQMIENKSNWHTVKTEKDNKHWLISFNIKQEKVIVEEFFIERDRILIKNPRVSLHLSKVINQMLKQTNVPKELWKNSFNHAKKALEREIQSVKLKSARRAKQKGRPRENYYRVATLKAIKNHKISENRTIAVKRIYPFFQKQATSEESFISRVLTLWRETSRAYTSEKKCGFTFIEFAKIHLKQKTKSLNIRSKVKRNK